MLKSRRWHGCLSFVSVVCLQIEVSLSGWSLVQRSPTDCGVSECNREALIIGFTGSLGAVAPRKTEIPFPFIFYADSICDLPSPENSECSYPAKSWFHGATPVLQSQQCIRWELKYCTCSVTCGTAVVILLTVWYTRLSVTSETAVVLLLAVWCTPLPVRNKRALLWNYLEENPG